MGLSKTGVFSANGENLSNNLLLNSNGIIVDKRNNALDSRTEYFAWDVGQSYANITTTTNITISFDLEMLVRDVSGYGGILQLYNTNNKGLVQLSSVSYTFKNEYAVGDYINKRISLNTTLVPRDNPTQQKNFIEFYTGYGTNNFYKISNVKIQTDTRSNIWTPNSIEGTLFHGFVEGTNIAKIFEGHVEANEFIEF